MSRDWFYRQPGAPQEAGPVTFEALQELGSSGQLARTALVREGDGAWHLAQSMEELWIAPSANTAANTPTNTDAGYLGDLETVLSFDDLDMQVVDETAPISTPTSLDDLGFNLVDETDASSPGSLDDLGLNIVDESSAAAVPRTRQGSRVLGQDEWTDPDAFQVDHVTPRKSSARDALDLDPELLDLADNALTGSSPSPSSGSSRKHSTAGGGAPSGEYFIRVDGKPHGPIDFPTLRTWAEEGRLVEQDEIQLPGADIWIPAAALPMLFEGVAATKPTVAPAAAPPSSRPAPGAAPVPAAASKPAPVSAARAPAPPASPPPASAPAAPSPPAFSSPASSYAPPAAKKATKPRIDRGPSAIGSMFSGLFSGGGDSTISPGIAIGILAVVGLFFGWSYLPSFKDNANDYEALIAVYAKSLEIREKGGADWAGFAGAAKEENKERIATLKKTASSKEPELQRMLWASEALDSVLGGQSKPDSKADVSFREHMATARSILGPETPPVPGYEGEYHFGGSAQSQDGDTGDDEGSSGEE